MLIVIVYSEQFTDNAKSLSGAIKERWTDAGVNLMGTFGKSNDFSKYQIQLGRDIIYISESVIDNGTAIDLIEERV
jgi:hypothetical protein